MILLLLLLLRLPIINSHNSLMIEIGPFHLDRDSLFDLLRGSCLHLRSLFNDILLDSDSARPGHKALRLQHLITM